jgi:hypothetical protein
MSNCRSSPSVLGQGPLCRCRPPLTAGPAAPPPSPSGDAAGARPSLLSQRQFDRRGTALAPTVAVRRDLRGGTAALACRASPARQTCLRGVPVPRHVGRSGPTRIDKQDNRTRSNRARLNQARIVPCRAWAAGMANYTSAPQHQTPFVGQQSAPHSIPDFWLPAVRESESYLTLDREPSCLLSLFAIVEKGDSEANRIPAPFSSAPHRFRQPRYREMMGS